MRSRRATPVVGIASSAIQPIGRSRGVHEQQVAERRGVRALGRAAAASSPTAADGRLDQLEVATRLRASRLRPRSAPTNRATNSDAGLARISAGVPNWATMPAVLEDGDEVAHLDGLVDVVGHEEDRLGELLLEAQELVLEAIADDRVDRAERLVHEHDRRVDGERPGDADALALAARQLAREAVAVLGRVEPDEARAARRRAACWRSFGPAQQARHRGDVLADRLVREQARPAG